ncbi:hypothetical protein [Amycolatopsis sp. MEPSY49]|uniref:hypothetical protein n=1 Tax=Amycolatopsis sp. MEPSY49 TaxID=3151600 RepID=UPI003EF97C07
MLSHWNSCTASRRVAALPGTPTQKPVSRNPALAISVTTSGSDLLLLNWSLPIGAHWFCRRRSPEALDRMRLGGVRDARAQHS